jgi:hypothetical protein
MISASLSLKQKSRTSARLAAQPEPIDPAVFAKDERLALLDTPSRIIGVRLI